MKPKFRPSLAQTRRVNQEALDWLRASSYRADAPRIDTGAKPKRASGSSGEPVEADVLRAVTQLLARHPAVIVAIRMNSGMAQNANGAPIWFHKLVKGRGVVVDFIGWMRTDIDFLPFAIECKRPSWQPGKAHGNTAIREDEQARFLEGVQTVGGRAGFATSVDEALAILEGKA